MPVSYTHLDVYKRQTSDYIETLNGIATESAKTTSTFEEKKMNSYFGRVNYNYDMKYLFSASIR